MLSYFALILEILYLVIPFIALVIWMRDWLRNKRKMVSFLRAFGFAIVSLFFIPIVLFRLVDQVKLFYELHAIKENDVSRITVGTEIVEDPSVLYAVEEQLRHPTWHFHYLIDKATHIPMVIKFMEREDLRLEVHGYCDQGGALINLRLNRSGRSLHWTRGYLYVSDVADILQEQGITILENPIE